MARDQPRRRSPGDRPPGGEVCEFPVPAGGGWAALPGGSEGHPRRAPPETREGRENKDLRPFVSWEGNGEADVSPLGIYGVGGGPLGGGGGKETASPTGEQRAGRRSAGAPPLVAEALPPRLRGEPVGNASLTRPGWEEPTALLFPGREETGRRFPLPCWGRGRRPLGAGLRAPAPRASSPTPWARS